MLRTRWMAAPACALLLVVGCADDASDGGTTTTTTAADDGGATTTRPAIDPDSIEGGEQAYVDALVAAYLNDPTSSPLEDEEQASCLARSWVGILGIDRLTGAGLAPDQITSGDQLLADVEPTREEAEAMVRGMADCTIDVREVIIRSLDAVIDLSSQQEQCLGTAITEAVAVDAYVSQVLGEATAPPSFAPAYDCLDLSSLED